MCFALVHHGQNNLGVVHAGPANWYKQYPLCKLNSQSPIDIESSEAVQGVIFPDFRFHGYNSLPLGARYVAHNNGHSGACVCACVWQR